MADPSAVGQDFDETSSAGAWMPLWVGDIQTSTSRLTAEQFGAYVRLLMDYWSNGPLPADDTQLSQITRLTKCQLRRMRPILLRYFEERDGKWFQNRSDEERKKAKVLAAQRSQKARKAAETRWAGGSVKDFSGSAPSMLRACSPSSQSKSNYKNQRRGSENHPTVAKQSYDHGLSLLTAHGTSHAEARSIISAWLDRYDQTQVLATIWAAELCDDLAEPVVWIELELQKRTAAERVVYDDQVRRAKSLLESD